MVPPTMHDDEVPVDGNLVRRLLASSFPAWRDLPLAPVASAGTDHALYRLGHDMAVRLPRIDWALGQIEHDAWVLPRLAPHLPVAIPAQLGIGEPAAGYPWRWAVYRWLEGDALGLDRPTDPHRLATDLAAFVVALRALDTDGVSPPGPGSRLAPLIGRDADTRGYIASLRATVDTAALTVAWEDALLAPAWDRPGVWAHTDLLPGNLLLVDDRLTAVIDLGGAGVGDPAVDVMPAWATLPRGVRDVFRAAVDVDDATWARGRGWALVFAVAALPYYRDRNPTLASIAARTIDEILREREA